MPQKPRQPYLQGGHSLNRGLVGAWLFSQAGSNIGFDAAGSQQHLSFSTFPTWLGSITGPAVYLSGSEKGQKTSVPYYSEVTFLARVRRQSNVGSTFVGIAGHHTTNGVGSDWFLYFHSDNLLHVDIPWIAGNVVVGATAVSDTTKEHVVGFSRSGSTGSWTYKVYLDGRVDGTGTTASNPSTSAQDFRIGDVAANANEGNVFIEARLWRRTLTPGEVLAFYNTNYSEFIPIRQPAFDAGAAPTTFVPIIDGGLLRRGITGGRLAA